MYGVLLSCLWVSSLALIVQLHSKLLVTVRYNLQTVTGAHCSYSCARPHALLPRWKLSATTYKQKDIEGNYLPPTPGLLTKKQKCKQTVSVTERRGRCMTNQAYDLQTVHTAILQKTKQCLSTHGDRGGTVVKALCYKSEGRWFDPRWFHWNFSLT